MTRSADGEARLGEITPERAPLEEQVWHTYPPVEMPSARRSRPDRLEIGLLRKRDRAVHTASRGRSARADFEIEVAAGTDGGRPMFTRGYVTITALVTPDEPDALATWFAELEDGLARYGQNEPRAVPEGGTPLVGFDLTTHQGHFMGNGHNRLVLYLFEGKAWVRAAGSWDPMPWHVDGATDSPARRRSTPFGVRAAVSAELAAPAREGTG